MPDLAHQRCINPDCAGTFGLDEVIFGCPKCGALLDIEYDWDRLEVPKTLRFFEDRWGTKGFTGQGQLDFSGVWRFRELLPFAPADQIVTIGEGRTLLEQNDRLARELGSRPGASFCSTRASTLRAASKTTA